MTTLEKKRAAQARYRETHREELRAKERARHAADREKYRELDKQYRFANREKDLARKRAWMLANRDKRNAAVARWREAHPEKACAYDAMRRARKRNAEIVENIDRSSIYDRDGGRCHICGERANRGDFHLDHLVPLARGGNHSCDNVAVAHSGCNLRRGAGRSPAQLRLLP